MKRSRINPVSLKRRRVTKAYRTLVEELRQRAGLRCENPFCRLKSNQLDPHHVPKRSQGAPLDDPDHIIILARNCHQATDWDDDRPGALRVEPLGSERFIVRRLKDDKDDKVYWDVMIYQRPLKEE